MGYYDSFFAAVEHVEADAELLRQLVRADEPATIDVDGTPRGNVAKQIADAVARINGDADSILAAVRAAANAVATDRAAVTEQAGQALDDLNVALTGAIEALEESQAELRDQVVTLRDEVIAKREAVATDRIAVSNQRQLAEDAATAAAGDAEQTAADRTATTEARDRAEAAADRTAGLASWESNGRVITTELLIKSATVARADLPSDAPDGARAWVPDCPAPAHAIARARGAECVSVSGRWLRLSDHGPIFAPISDVFGDWYGLYTRAELGLIYQSDDRSTPVTAVDETIGTFADAGRQGLDLTQSVVSRRASWTGDSARVDGIDDRYSVQTELVLGGQSPLYTAFCYRSLTGTDLYRSAFSIGRNIGSFHLGLDSSSSVASARIRLTDAQLDIDTVDARISDGLLHTIEFAVTTNGLMRLWIDGDLVNQNDASGSFLADDKFYNLYLDLFDQSAMDFMGFAVAQADPSSAERADIRRYLEFGS